MIGPRPSKQTAADERHARELVKNRDEGLCVRCGRPGTNFDHRKGRGRGGRWEAANGQTLCGSGTTGCHGWVTSHPAEALEHGFDVPGYAHPELWPAYRVGLGFVLYDNTGGFQLISDATARLLTEGQVG